MGRVLELPQPHPPASCPPILTDMAVDALPARDAITVIATNQVFARKSIKARLPFTLIGVCERDKGVMGPRRQAPIAPALPAAATTCRACSPCTHVPQGALTQLAGGPHPLLRADALEAIHLIHAGAPCCTRAGGTFINVCRETEKDQQHSGCVETGPWGGGVL